MKSHVQKCDIDACIVRAMQQLCVDRQKIWGFALDSTSLQHADLYHALSG